MEVWWGRAFNPAWKSRTSLVNEPRKIRGYGEERPWVPFPPLSPFLFLCLQWLHYAVYSGPPVNASWLPQALPMSCCLNCSSWYYHVPHTSSECPRLSSNITSPIGPIKALQMCQFQKGSVYPDKVPFSFPFWPALILSIYLSWYQQEATQSPGVTEE